MSATTIDELEQDLARSMEWSAALLADRLEVIASLAERDVWRADGMRSMADWLVARFAMSPSEAHEHVRVAGASGTFRTSRSACARAICLSLRSARSPTSLTATTSSISWTWRGG
jgi:hypothetical protein